MKGKILYIGGFELPDKNAAAQRVLANAKLFRDIGFDVVLLGVDKQLSGGEVVQYNVPVDGFPSYAIPYPTGILSWLKFICRIEPAVRLAKEGGVRAIVAYNFPAIALFRLLTWCRSRGIALISDCTEWYLPNGNILRKAIKRADIFFRMKIVHPKLDGMIAISRYLFDWYAPRMKYVLQLPPLVDKEDAKWIEEKKFTGDNKLCFVYAGSPGKTKDRLDWTLSVFSDVFARTGISFVFYVLGISKSDYEESSSLPANISEYVIFKGRVPHKEVIEILRGANYQVFFRERNLPNMAGFPTKFVESISCGVPVVTNRFSNIEDYLGKGENGVLVNIEDRQAAIDEICAVFRRGAAGVPCVLSATFDYRNYTESMNEFLGKIFCTGCNKE